MASVSTYIVEEALVERERRWVVFSLVMEILEGRHSEKSIDYLLLPDEAKNRGEVPKHPNKNSLSPIGNLIHEHEAKKN
eukprot:CAMPEP_0116828860 /NCGR_PEP_ID=MMETSP0418-20121206/3878_1 /TAXON_ID=1158023 /ORGANISM="Astrosyne radiata, Strain 13vi08-1A" /LENGTH=78 /DNA_ID=CAMNT_0004457771 /DNA_START=72 /DNA_END=308 /DNA_ORIENTATION=-